MAQHAEAHEWQGYGFREEDTTKKRWHVGKCISDAADDDVLEDGCSLDKRTAVLVGDDISLPKELVWKDEDLCDCEHQHGESRYTMLHTQ